MSANNSLTEQLSQSAGKNCEGEVHHHPSNWVDNISSNDGQSDETPSNNYAGVKNKTTVNNETVDNHAQYICTHGDLIERVAEEQAQINKLRQMNNNLMMEILTKQNENIIEDREGVCLTAGRIGQSEFSSKLEKMESELNHHIQLANKLINQNVMLRDNLTVHSVDLEIMSVLHDEESIQRGLDSKAVPTDIFKGVTIKSEDVLNLKEKCSELSYQSKQHIVHM